ncbi:patatin-like phospholipase family protein [Pinisolibacter sp.]|uniref:patatin-like phospholipase family protein n=1 Tax=Pinisolibacter sp. TaxID=2172024 RepID=UPI002FDEE049
MADDIRPPSATDHPTAASDFSELLAPYDRVALLLQGGGALGSYQVGVYETLAEAGIEPTWISGVSIGAINTALIAGNPPERRLERLETFWKRITRNDQLGGLGSFDFLRPMIDGWNAFAAMTLGQPGFFKPRLPSPWLMPRGSDGATSFYETGALAETLEELVDFRLLNEGPMRVSVGAVAVETGNLEWFDTRHPTKPTRIGVRHIMASGALPPALPAVKIGDLHYWDGGIVSNTPLEYLLDQDGDCSALVFQVDLFPAQGAMPQDMNEVLTRQKDITYSSRTRAGTTRFAQTFCLRQQLRAALERVPSRTEEDERLLADLRAPGVVDILHLIYRARAGTRDSKDYEFSVRSAREHRAAGRADAVATLKRRDWFTPPSIAEGVKTHDIHDHRHR